jgi:hypothetical protein
MTYIFQSLPFIEKTRELISMNFGSGVVALEIIFCMAHPAHHIMPAAASD